MEFVEGETLENLIKRSGRLEVKRYRIATARGPRVAKEEQEERERAAREFARQLSENAESQTESSSTDRPTPKPKTVLIRSQEPIPQMPHLAPVQLICGSEMKSSFRRKILSRSICV